MPEFLLIASDKTHPSEEQPNIVVPYADQEKHVWRATKLNLEMQGFTPRYVNMKSDLMGDFAYDRLFRELWAEGKPFILVEHDILPWPGALQELWECECQWGAFAYYIFGEFRTQLGCVKFDPARIGECPLDERVHWSRLDWAIINGLANRGETGHLHSPPVIHLNFAHQRMRSPVKVNQDALMA